MGKARIALGVMSFALLGAVLGYVLASAFLTFRWFGVGADIDFLMLARSYGVLRSTHPGDMQIVHLIVGISTGAGVLLSAVLMNDALTKFGETHWQQMSEMKRNGFFGKPGHGFVLGKMGKPSGEATCHAKRHACQPQFLPHELASSCAVDELFFDDFCFTVHGVSPRAGLAE